MANDSHTHSRKSHIAGDNEASNTVNGTNTSTHKESALSMYRRRFIQATGVAGVAGVAGQVSAVPTDSPNNEREVLAPNMDGLSYWENLMFCCLEGLANRDSIRVIHYYDEKSTESWYDEYPSIPIDKRIFYNWYKQYSFLDFVEFDDPYRLFENLDPLPFEGYVIVDTTAPITANIAANYAGIENLLPVTETLLDRKELPDLDIVYDLRGEFKGVDFSKMTRVEVYRWAFENQWPDANHSRVANLGTPDGGVGKPDIDISEYTANNDTIYLKFTDADPSDGAGTQLHLVRMRRNGKVVDEVVPTSKHEQEVLVTEEGTATDEERNIRWCGGSGEYWVYKLSGVQGADDLELILRNQYLVSISTSVDGPYDELVSNFSKFGSLDKYGIIDLPVNAFFTSNRSRDYTVAEGGFFFDLTSAGGAFPAERELKGKILDAMESRGYVFGWHTARGSEGQHISHLSKYGQLSIGASTYASNFSFHSRLEVPGAVQRFEQEAEHAPVAESAEEKIYLTFVLSDGDSLNFLTRRAQGGQWLLDARGEIPFGWEMAPVLTELGQGILDYFQATATDNDYFTVGPSGMGYFYPEVMPTNLLEGVLEETSDYLEKTGLSAQTVMSPPKPVDNETAQLYQELVGQQLTGVMEGYVRRAPDTERLFRWDPDRSRRDAGPPPHVESTDVTNPHNHGGSYDDFSFNDSSFGDDDEEEEEEEYLFREEEGEEEEEDSPPVRMMDTTAWVPTSFPMGTETVDALVEGFERVADRRLRRPLFVPVHVPAHTLTIADMVDVVNQLNSDVFEVVSPDAFYSLFAQERSDTILLRPPEGFSPDKQLLRGGETNEITYRVKSFDNEQREVSVQLTLMLGSLDDPITSETEVTLQPQETTKVTTSIDVPKLNNGDGRLEYMIDGDKTVISVPILPLSQIKSEWIYEAENTNHRDGHQVSDPEALNDTAWQATPEGTNVGDAAPDHIVWYPTTDQDIAGNYVARFRMKVNDNTIEKRVARLDVIENVPGSAPQGDFPTLDLSGTDFRTAGEYEWFEIPFSIPLTDAPLSDSQRQYRVEYGGETALTIDRIKVISQFGSD